MIGGLMCAKGLLMNDASGKDFPGKKGPHEADEAKRVRGTDTIKIRGARTHNLANIDLDLPRDRMIVITGLSGSGKSSLAFDTIYAEGQRRYVESLSVYARQFLEQTGKPAVDTIDGLSPAVAIEQKSASRNPRSTVGTITEIYDHLRLLFARVGQPHCPVCDRAITRQTVQQMCDRILDLDAESRIQILAPVARGKKGEFRSELAHFSRLGFVRVRIDGVVRELGDEFGLAKNKNHDIDVVVDRLVVNAAARGRIAESLEAALRLTDGLVRIDIGPGDSEWLLSERTACIDRGGGRNRVEARHLPRLPQGDP
jgi:excinuclease ABC subunit A